MTVNAQDIHRIAYLARLNISENKILEYTQNLNNLLNFAEQMTQIETENIPPIAHPAETHFQRLREDVVTEKDQREQFQKIAPEISGGLYILPKVIE